MKEKSKLNALNTGVFAKSFFYYVYQISKQKAILRNILSFNNSHFFDPQAIFVQVLPIFRFPIPSSIILPSFPTSFLPVHHMYREEF